MANPLRGQFAFPLAGEGAYLRFSNSALAEIEAEYGVDWWQNIMNQLDQGHSEQTAPVVLLTFLLGRGLWLPEDKSGSNRKTVIDELQPLMQACRPLQEALCLAVSGLSYDDFVKRIEEKTAEMEKAIKNLENPQTPAASSAMSGAAPSGQD